MNKRAYLVIGINTATTPPTVIGAGIFSEERPTTLKMTVQTVVVAVADGVDYESARDRLVALVERAPEHAWLLPLLVLDNGLRRGQVLTGAPWRRQ